MFRAFSWGLKKCYVDLQGVNNAGWSPFRVEFSTYKWNHRTLWLEGPVTDTSFTLKWPLRHAVHRIWCCVTLYCLYSKCFQWRECKEERMQEDHMPWASSPCWKSGFSVFVVFSQLSLALPFSKRNNSCASSLWWRRQCLEGAQKVSVTTSWKLVWLGWSPCRFWGWRPDWAQCCWGWWHYCLNLSSVTSSELTAVCYWKVTEWSTG